MKLLLEERTSRFEIFKKWFLRAVVALLFIAIGSNKFAAHSPWVKIFEMIGFGQWFRYFTGGLEVLCAILLLVPKTAAIGAAILVATMVGAIATHLFIIGSSPVPATVILLMTLAVAWYRRPVSGGEKSEVCTCSKSPS